MNHMVEQMLKAAIAFRENQLGSRENSGLQRSERERGYYSGRAKPY